MPFPFRVLHACGRIGRPLDAIGGYARNINHGLALLGEAAEMLDHYPDSNEAIPYLMHECERVFFEAHQIPILHLQLTHPWCRNPFSPEFLSTFPYPVVVTCQELRRMAELDGVDAPAILRYIISVLRVADRIIFIDRNELALAERLERKFYPREKSNIAEKSHVIEAVPGGVKVLSELAPAEDRRDIVHFGMFRYGKGLYEIGQFAQFFCEWLGRDERRMHIIGSLGVDQEKELHQLLHMTHGLSMDRLSTLSLAEIIHLLKTEFADHPIQYHINLPEEAVSALLAHMQYGVFLFPEGATRYGSSIPAAIAHGIVPIVTHGPDTPKAFTVSSPEVWNPKFPSACVDGAAIVVQNTWDKADAAFRAYCAALASPGIIDEVRDRGERYTSGRIPLVVATSHREVYGSLEGHPKIEWLSQMRKRKEVAVRGVHKSLAAFKFTQYFHEIEDRSHLAFRLRKEKTDKVFYAKCLPADEHPSRAPALIQALTGEFCRLLAGPRYPYPKNRLIHTEQGTLVLSREVPEAMPLKTYLKQHDHVSLSSLRGLGFACGLGLFSIETDFKLANLLVSERGEVVKIDFDLSWSRERYHLFWAEMRHRCFDLTPEMIDALPFPGDYSSFNWLDIVHSERPTTSGEALKCWETLRQNEDFRREVNAVILKLLILPKRLLPQFISQYVFSKTEESQAKDFLSAVTKRLQELKRAAMQNFSFLLYLKSERALGDRETIIQDVLSFRTTQKRSLIAEGDAAIWRRDMIERFETLRTESESIENILSFLLKNLTRELDSSRLTGLFGFVEGESSVLSAFLEKLEMHLGAINQRVHECKNLYQQMQKIVQGLLPGSAIPASRIYTILRNAAEALSDDHTPEMHVF